MRKAGLESIVPVPTPVLMNVIDELRALKYELLKSRRPRTSVAEITPQLPVRYRTHLLSAWKRYLRVPNYGPFERVVERLITELET